MTTTRSDQPTDAGKDEATARRLMLCSRYGPRSAGEDAIAQALAAARREGASRENEACARVVETQYRRDPDGVDKGWDQWATKKRLAERIAAAIRAREPREEPSR